MKVLVSGATGFIGKAVVERLSHQGHEIWRLVRREPARQEVHWDPEDGDFAAGALEGFDAVVHLAGENIAGRWTAAKKKRIRNSRTDGTRYLSNALAGLARRPKVYLCASAIGYYGDRGSELLSEGSTPGSGFLAEVCREWESATTLARESGIRVVNLRIGMVLDGQGGGLAKMLLPFKLGAGGILGDGQQYMSWVSLADVVGVIEFALQNEALKGPVNTVAPQAVTNYEFTKTLGKVLHRPTIFPMPAAAAKIVFGEMAEALLLASTRVEPKALISAGYAFKHPQLEACLRAVL